MEITRLTIRNYKCFRTLNLDLDSGVNIIVGDNDQGKSTILEAIELCASGRLKSAPIDEQLSHHWFNRQVSTEYLNEFNTRGEAVAPRITIEIYLKDEDELTLLKGRHNTEDTDCPGLTLTIAPDPELEASFSSYLTQVREDKRELHSIPTEFYTADWRSFRGSFVPYALRSLVKPLVIDGVQMNHASETSRFIRSVFESTFDLNQQSRLSVRYRELVEDFGKQEEMEGINAHLNETTKNLPLGKLAIGTAIAGKHRWLDVVVPFIDMDSFQGTGHGKKFSTSILLALLSASGTNLITIEEPESHLSHSRMHQVLAAIEESIGSRQLVISTHSTYVLNRLGMDKLILLRAGRILRLTDLEESTVEYFRRLPRSETLRLLCSRAAVMVEGASDEMVFRRAFQDETGKTLESEGIEALIVGTSFKRFIQVAQELDIPVACLTDDDDLDDAAKTRFGDIGSGKVRGFVGTKAAGRTLEDQIVSAAGTANLAEIFPLWNSDEYPDLADWLKKNKTENALTLFLSDRSVPMPEYIVEAVHYLRDHREASND